MLPSRQLGLHRQFAIGIGEKRVLAPGCGDHAFGEPDDEHRVEVETDAGRQTRAEHTFAVPADPPDRRSQLHRDGTREDRKARVGFHGVEHRAAVQHEQYLRQSFTLGRRPGRSSVGITEQVGQHGPGLVGPRRPARGLLHHVQPSAKVGDERSQGAGGLRFLPEPCLPPDARRRPIVSLLVQISRVGIEAEFPTVSVHDSGSARDPIPSLDGDRSTIDATHRGAGEERDEFIAGELCADEVEHPTECPPGRRVGEGAHGRTVVGDGSGLKLRVDGARVRLDRRIQDRHPVERHSGLGDRQQPPQHRPHFVVRIGGGDDFGSRRHRPRLGHVEHDAERPARGPHGIVGGVVSRQADQRDARPDAEHLGNERAKAWWRRLRKMQHDRTQCGDRDITGGDRRDRVIGQRVFVGEVVEATPHALTDLDQGLRAHGTGPGDPIERLRLGPRQFGVPPGQCPLGTRVGRHRTEHAGIGTEFLADRRDQQGFGELFLAGERCAGPTQTLGHGVRREEPDIGEPTVAGNHPPSGQAGRIRRDDHGHGSQPILGLEAGDHAGQRSRRGRAVAHSLHRIDHRGTVPTR